MIRNQVDRDLDALVVRSRNHGINVRECSEQRVDVAIVSNVVTVINLRTRQERTQPQRIDVERCEVVDVLDNALQVTGSIAVRVSE